MRQLQEKRYKEKELLNLRNKQNCLNDLRFLKEQEIKGPFSCAEDVKRFMDSCEETKRTIQRMYIEVRYAKASSGMGDNKSMFRLKKDGKLLTLVDYQNSLLRYFEGTQRTKTVSMADPNNVLAALNSKKFFMFPL